MAYKINLKISLVATLYLLVLIGSLFLIINKFRELEEVKGIEPPTNFQGINYTNTLNKSVDIRLQSVTIFFFFNTECEHCQTEAALVKREIKQFSDKKVYFLSIETIDEITAFAEEYQLAEEPNVTFGSISPATATAFGISGFPTTLIYSDEGKLLKKFKGEVKIEAIVNL